MKVLFLLGFIVTLIVATERLIASDPVTGDNFGKAVALAADGTTAVIGANLKTVANKQYAGAAYIFTQTDDEWTQQAMLTASDASAGDAFFGLAVDIDSDGLVALVGAPSRVVDGNARAGAVYLFDRPSMDSATWTEQTKLTLPANDLKAEAEFGKAVALNADATVAVVGAPGSDYLGKFFLHDAGAAYIFTRPNSNSTVWTMNDKLHANDLADGALFGTSVSLDAAGLLLLVGDGSVVSEGAVYVFTRPSVDSTTWTLETKLTSGTGDRNLKFGLKTDLSADGKMAAINAPNAASWTGQVYIFTNTDGVWSMEVVINGTSTGDQLGASLALSSDGSRLLAGAPYSDSNGLTDAGAVTLFTRDPSSKTWSKEATVHAETGQTDAQFGFSVALAQTGTVMMIGAAKETLTGNLVGAGAAYVACSRATNCLFSECSTNPSAAEPCGPVQQTTTILTTTNNNNNNNSSSNNNNGNGNNDQTTTAVAGSMDGASTTTADNSEDENSAFVSSSLNQFLFASILLIFI